MKKQTCSVQEPEKISSYLRLEKWTLVIVVVSGCIYNVGMTAGPWFEGRMAQYLYDIIDGRKEFGEMAALAVSYVAVILLVQMMRFVKRLYVRKFANHINRDMKRMLYRSLVHKSKVEFETEETGDIMTKAISDVDTCVEGIRKFTTEIFDTGVVMLAYLFMLVWYDWRLTMLSMLFPPIAYLIAEQLKKPVSLSAGAYKESAGRLNGAALDRVTNAMTYRVYGQEKNQDTGYEKCLLDYERKAVRASIWETSMQPLYQLISMTGVLVILWFGGKNVRGNGCTSWDIAAFTTFLSCFTKLAVKSSKGTKLFNAVQKARVSWRRIRPLFVDAPVGELEGKESVMEEASAELAVQSLAFGYPGEKEMFSNVSFEADMGEIIGVTGPVASGKSTFGRVFLCENPYRGSIRFGGRELSERMGARENVVAYLGHQPELLGDTIKANIMLGDEGDVMFYLRAVRMDQEVLEMPDGVDTKLGDGGVRLSGGQQARIALARTLCHKRPIMILDDPFSAVDQRTELEIIANLQKMGDMQSFIECRRRKYCRGWHS